MNFNTHYDLKDRHAFLSASKYHWINYDSEKLRNSYLNFEAVQMGTRLHAYAAESILLHQKLPRNKNTLNMYVNDAIGFRMQPEQVLYYSENCFGTTDAISFRKEKGVDTLRIHDLKTGVTPAHMEQLMIYMSLFCLEYQIKPEDIFAELRIYQSNEILACNPEPDEIHEIMDKIVEFDKVINCIKLEE